MVLQIGAETRTIAKCYENSIKRATSRYLCFHHDLSIFKTIRISLKFDKLVSKLN